MLPSIHQRYTDNLLLGASVTAAPSPMSTYDEATLLTLVPGARVRWDTGTVTLHFALVSEQRADLLVIPVWNVAAGATVAVLESDAGMSVAVTVPAMLPSGIPRTTAIDLTLLEPDPVKRTSDGFDLIVTGNPLDLIMGGAVLLYGPKRTFVDTEWEWGFTQARRGFSIVHENDYGTDLVYPHRTRRRSYVASTKASAADAETIDAWADANFDQGLPGLMWPFPDRYEAYFGRLEDTQQQRTQPGDAVEIAVTFTELSKGKPIVTPTDVEPS